MRFHAFPEFELPEMDAWPMKECPGDPRDSLCNWLLETIPFEVPDALVQAELERDDMLEIESDTPLWKAAKQRVKLLLIFRRIAREKGIEVDQRDLEDRIRDTADNLDTPEKQLRRALEENGGQERLRDLLIAEATQDSLLEKHAPA